MHASAFVHSLAALQGTQVRLSPKALPQCHNIIIMHATQTYGAQCGSVVFKIVPMEGAALVNGERQKGAADLLAEVEIALALSALRGTLGGFEYHDCTQGLMLTSTT